MKNTTLETPAYCVSGPESCAAARKVHAWLEAKTAAGCTVEWKIRGSENLGVIWQVITDPLRPYAEFSEYIDMYGNTGSMN